MSALPEGFADVLPQPLELRPGRRVVVEEPVAHPERSELERPRAVQATVVEPRDLRAPSADVERRTARDGQVVHGADEAEPGLGVAVDDLQRHPELSRALEQEVSVERVADGRGGDREDPIGARPFRDGAEVPEGFEGSFDRLRTELGAGVQLARQPERRARVLDHVEVLPPLAAGRRSSVRSSTPRRAPRTAGRRARRRGVRRPRADARTDRKGCG